MTDITPRTLIVVKELLFLIILLGASNVLLSSS
jgi:hypothetical protein